MTVECERICRFCLLTEAESEKLYNPCKCGGSVEYIHKSCLLKWVESNGLEECEICHFKYKFQHEYNERININETLLMLSKAIQNFLYQLIRKGLYFGPMILFWAFFGFLGCLWMNLEHRFFLYFLIGGVAMGVSILFLYLFSLVQDYCRDVSYQTNLNDAEALRSIEKWTVEDSIYTENSQYENNIKSILTDNEKNTNTSESIYSDNHVPIPMILPDINDNFRLSGSVRNTKFDANIFLTELKDFIFNFTYPETIIFKDLCIYCLFLLKTCCVFVMILTFFVFTPFWLGSFVNLINIHNDLVWFSKGMHHYSVMVFIFRLICGYIIFYMLLNCVNKLSKQFSIINLILAEIQSLFRLCIFGLISMLIIPYTLGLLIQIWVIKYINLRVLTGYNENIYLSWFKLLKSPILELISISDLIKKEVSGESSFIFRNDAKSGLILSINYYRYSFLKFFSRIVTFVFTFGLYYQVVFFILSMKKLFKNILRPGIFYDLYLTENRDFLIETIIRDSCIYISCFLISMFGVLLFIIFWAVQMLSFILKRFDICFIINSTTSVYFYFGLMVRISREFETLKKNLSHILSRGNLFLSKILKLDNYFFNNEFKNANVKSLIWYPNQNIEYCKNHIRLKHPYVYNNSDVKTHFIERNSKCRFLLFYRPKLFLLRLITLITVNCILILAGVGILIHFAGYLTFIIRGIWNIFERHTLYIEVRDLTDNHIEKIFLKNYEKNQYSFIIFLYSILSILRIITFTLNTIRKKMTIDSWWRFISFTKARIVSTALLITLWPFLICLCIHSLWEMFREQFSIQNIFAYKQILITSFFISMIYRGLLQFSEVLPQEITESNYAAYLRIVLRQSIYLFIFACPFVLNDFFLMKFLPFDPRKIFIFFFILLPATFYLIYFFIHKIFTFTRKRYNKLYNALYLKEKVLLNYQDNCSTSQRIKSE